MKKILIAVTFIFGIVGSAQAADIDGQSSGINGIVVGSMHNITGFGIRDTFVGQSNPSASSVSVVDAGFPHISTSLNTDGMVAGFIHDYEFQSVQDTWTSIQGASETISAGSFIDKLVLEVWEILAGADVLLASQTLSNGGGGGANTASIQTLFEAGHNYVVRMSNEFNALGGAGTLGTTTPDYSLEIVSAVPVPAAVWLFGTALLGFIGYGRKSGAAKAVAA